MGDYDFDGISTTDLHALRAEQTHVLEATGAKQRIATDPDRVATLEAEVLFGFELLAAIDSEIAER